MKLLAPRSIGLAVLLASALALPALAATGPLMAPPPADIGARVHVAQNQTNAELLVRIQDLEELVRQLTGRIEGLEFQVTQMQKQQEDNEFRFQQLEGGEPGKPQAAVPTDGATPSEQLPQEQIPETSPQALPPVADQPPSSAEQLPATPNGTDQPMDFGLGESSDPLLNGGTDQLGTMDDDGLNLDPGTPLDLSQDGGQISNGDAKAQYEAGYDAITRGDYAFAEDQLTQFIALYPDDPNVPDAINWLGEALIQRGAYTDAAQVLADGYTKHKDSKRAPDMMLKLGVALIGADQHDVGCRTFYTLKQRYPDLAPAFQQRLAQENQKAQCPVI